MIFFNFLIFLFLLKDLFVNNALLHLSLSSLDILARMQNEITRSYSSSFSSPADSNLKPLINLILRSNIGLSSSS